jgi:MarR-like DNA-binding transcriptional regulator SgrR of sgrS sRNA
MPYKKKNRGKQANSPIVQWLNKKTGQYEKIERATGIVVSEKVTPGPYKNFELVKRRPRRRKVQKAPAKGHVSKKKIEAVKKVKKVKAKPDSALLPKKKTNYLNNKDLLAEVILSKQQGKMTDKLARMLQMLCARYGRRGNFANYTYNEDMQAYAMMMLVRTWNSFNPEKSKNPFAFFTQCVKNSFIQFLNSEKRHRTLKDELLVDQGLNPSYSYQLDHEAKSEERRLELHENKVDPLTIREEKDDDELIEY